MANTPAQKLKIKDGFALRTIHAPQSFATTLAPLPPGVTVSGNGKNFHQLHWFVTNKAEVEKDLSTVLSILTDGVTCWVYYPKATSGMQTDLTRDKGWEAILQTPNLQWLSLVSFDETWSAFGFRKQLATDKKTISTPKERLIFQYIDVATKTVTPPADFAAALQHHSTENAFFNLLSYSNKKEYVEWIVTAVREETRKARVRMAIERLAKKQKNPANG